MLVALFLSCLATGAVMRLVQETQQAPEGYEGPDGLTLVERPALARREAWSFRSVARFFGASGGRRAFVARPS
jgi:hypothetical protein